MTHQFKIKDYDLHLINFNDGSILAHIYLNGEPKYRQCILKIKSKFVLEEELFPLLPPPPLDLRLIIKKYLDLWTFS